MYTKAALIAALASLASSTPVPLPTPQNFGIIASASTTIIHLRSIEASGQNFFIGRPSSTYCPPSAGVDCADTLSNSTVLTAVPNTSSTVSLAVLVPGGQQIYIAPDGGLSYTGAHSAAIPEGSITTGFTYTPQVEEGRVGTLAHEGGFVACPTADKDVFRIYSGDNTVAPASACIGLNIATSSYEGKTAWQY